MAYLQSTVLLHLNTLEKPIPMSARLLHCNLCIPVLSVSMGLDLSSIRQSDLLQTVADTENGYTGLENRRVDMRRILVVDGVWRTGQDDTCAT